MSDEIKALDLRRTLIPFVARVLRYGTARPHKPSHDPLPLGAWDSYCVEDFHEMSEVLGEGVIFALCHHAAGWQQRELLNGAEAWSARSTRLRLWESTSELSLEFTDSSLRLCEALHNIALKPGAMGPKMEGLRETAAATLASLEFIEAGDALVLYWMVSGLWNELGPSNRMRGARPHVKNLTTASLALQPLLMLRYGPTLEIENVGGSEAIVEIMNGSLRAAMPWLVDHALGQWRRVDDQIWEQPASTFVATRRSQAMLLQTWCSAIGHCGWYHLVVPFMETFSWQLGVLADAGETMEALAESAINKVNTSFRDEGQQVRFEVRRAWAQALDTISCFSKLHRSAIRIHPVDREGNHQWLIDWWARNDMSNLVDDVGTVARQIEGRLG